MNMEHVLHLQQKTILKHVKKTHKKNSMGNIV